MTADREQTRRDAHLIASRDHWRDRALKAEAELEQAERERDQATKWRDAYAQQRREAEARLAKVPALVEALRKIRDAKGNMQQFRGQIAADALAAWEQE